MNDRSRPAEERVKAFYDGAGWSSTPSGASLDAHLWEDLRPAAQAYVRDCRRRVMQQIPPMGDLLLDAASGPIQYPEYLEYSAGYRKRVCVDISEKALEQARARLGERGEYHCCSILDLPFPENTFDAVVSMHTIYHIDAGQQETAVRQLLRVCRPGARCVVVYANPDRLLARLKRALRPGLPKAATVGDAGYYHAHPLSWWDRFQDTARVTMLPWRGLTSDDSKRLIPDNRLGRVLFRGLAMAEHAFPDATTAHGAYPMVVLSKKTTA
jgi:ubiquinone/menaquinone biosynthesis C-methylase UbiE